MLQCTDPTFNPTFDPNSPFCAGFKRNQTGGIGNLQTTYFNNGYFETAGIDLSIAWGMDAGPGRVDANMSVNYLIDKLSRELDSEPLVDYVGTNGPTQNGLYGNSYEFKMLTTVGYTLYDLYLALRWQHLDAVDSTISINDPDTGWTGEPAYDMFDLLGSYQLMDNFRVRFGIENLFNKKPPYTGVNTAATGTELSGGSYSFSHDTNGRRFYVGGTVTF
jgi:outer membrane receptor protein involved in Fe transport